MIKENTVNLKGTLKRSLFDNNSCINCLTCLEQLSSLRGKNMNCSVNFPLKLRENVT